MTAKETILLVGDDQEVLGNTQAQLEAAGYAINSVTNGNAAKKILSENNFDLVLLDLKLPDIDGHEVMRFMADNDVGSSVIVLSGETSFECVSKAFHLGAYDFIQKPFEFESLHRVVINALKKKDLGASFTGLRKQLERSEKLHRFMIESSPDMIFIVDKDGYFAFVNDRTEAILGYSKDELIGQHYEKIVDPDYVDQAKLCFQERPQGARAIKDSNIWLNAKTGTHFGVRKGAVAIELSCLGVYENDETDANPKAADFSGTYAVARDITERLAAERLVHYQAFHDLLTGLPNRALFLDRLENAIRSARRTDEGLALMFLDLDRFKAVNDKLGHAVGDELLKQLSERLSGVIRESDTLARFGGDEFVVLLPSVKSDSVAQAISEKLISSISHPFEIEDQEIVITASLGISIYPRDGEGAETLIKSSDVAMYHTKELGRNSYNFYESDMSVKQHRLLNIENDIRQSLKKNLFEVFYQPQISTADESVVGVEALLRWNHPEKGLLFPSFFLSVAEETGLIVELGDWVLNTAIKEMNAWRESGIHVEKLAVNFSSKQIEQKDFVDKIINALKRYSFPPEALEVEITENILMNDFEGAISKLKQLHDIGISISIDDFGIGYSSLSLLQKLPISRLKIDRSFIKEMEKDSDRSIIEAIAHMAKGLNFEMVAEGVEEPYQLEYLKQLQCPVVQGFLYCRSVPSSEAKKYLKRKLEKNIEDSEQKIA